MNLKVPFIKLTIHNPKAGQPTEAWVNMSRCQEMYGYTEDEPWTALIMNIPDMSIAVIETPEEIISMLENRT